MQAPVQWDGKSKGSVIGTRIFLKLVSWVGLFPAYCLLAPVSLYYTFRQKESVRALRRFRSHLQLPTNRFHIWRHFFSFGMSLLDRYAFVGNPKTKFRLRIVNEPLILNAMKAGKGALLIGAHVGNSEIAGNLLKDRLGLTVNFAMVDAETNEMRTALSPVFARRRAAVIPINQDAIGFLFGALSALRRNEIVCLHADRMAGGRGLKARFLNGQATFPLGPFAIAAASGAPLIPFFAIKKGLRTYEIRSFEPIAVKGSEAGGMDTQCVEALTQYLSILERMVAENPYAWFNFYDFWGDDAKSSA